MVKRNIKWLLVVLVLGLYPSILYAEDPYGEMKALADSARKVLGQDRVAFRQCPVDEICPRTERYGTD